MNFVMCVMIAGLFFLNLNTLVVAAVMRNGQVDVTPDVRGYEEFLTREVLFVQIGNWTQDNVTYVNCNDNAFFSRIEFVRNDKSQDMEIFARFNPDIDMQNFFTNNRFLTTRDPIRPEFYLFQDLDVVTLGMLFGNHYTESLTCNGSGLCNTQQMSDQYQCKDLQCVDMICQTKFNQTRQNPN